MRRQFNYIFSTIQVIHHTFHRNLTHDDDTFISTFQVIHHTFDRNLTHDDDTDLMHHLQRSRVLRQQLPDRSNALLRSLSVPSKGHRSRPVTVAGPPQRQSAIEGEFLLAADGSKESAKWKRSTVAGADLSHEASRTPQGDPDGRNQAQLLRIHSAGDAKYSDTVV